MEEPVGIVGGSVAGMALACALADFGIPCALYDDGKPPEAGPAVLGTRSLEALARRGALPQTGRAFRRTRILYRGETLGYLPIAELPTRHPYLRAVQRPELVRELRDRALATGRVRLRTGQVLGVQGREDRARVLLEGTTATHSWLAVTTARLRRLLGVPLRANVPEAPSWSGTSSGVPDDELELRLGPSGMAWTYPVPGAPPALAAEAWRETDLPDLRTELGLPATATLESDPLPADTGFAAALQVGRVLLLGGAARTEPPRAWRCLDSDVGEADALAWRLAAVIRGADPDLMRGYEAERAPWNRARAAVGPSWLPRLTRPDTMALLGPLLKAAFVRKGLGEALVGLGGRYAPSRWCVDDRTGSRPGPAPGMRLPELRFEDGDGRRRWLLDLVGRQPLVLRFTTGHVQTPAGPVADRDGTLGRALRGRPGEVLVVRPDGIIGYRGWPERPASTADYLRRMGAPP